MEHEEGKLNVLDEGSLQALNVTKTSFKLWHKKMGHRNSTLLKTLHSWNKNFTICASSQMGKNCKLLDCLIRLLVFL